MLIKSSYTNSQNIFLAEYLSSRHPGSLHRTGLTDWSQPIQSSTSPIGPNQSSPRLLQPIRPMLSLSLNRFGPYVVTNPNDNAMYHVAELEGTRIEVLVEGKRVKIFKN